MPNIPDVRTHLLGQDVIWVGGGSVANLLAVWRAHGLDTIMREAWEAGVVLAGVSAGSLCWHTGGTTDSFGPDLRAVTNGLGLLPFSNTPHYDSEPGRRPLYQKLVADGTLPDGWATDDGVGLHFRGTELVEAVADRPDVYAWRVQRIPAGTGPTAAGAAEVSGGGPSGAGPSTGGAEGGVTSGGTADGGAVAGGTIGDVRETPVTPRLLSEV